LLKAFCELDKKLDLIKETLDLLGFLVNNALTCANPKKRKRKEKRMCSLVELAIDNDFIVAHVVNFSMYIRFGLSLRDCHIAVHCGGAALRHGVLPKVSKIILISLRNSITLQ
jgi:hypothetical protein